MNSWRKCRRQRYFTTQSFWNSNTNQTYLRSHFLRSSRSITKRPRKMRRRKHKITSRIFFLREKKFSLHNLEKMTELQIIDKVQSYPWTHKLKGLIILLLEVLQLQRQTDTISIKTRIIKRLRHSQKVNHWFKLNFQPCILPNTNFLQ